MADDLRSLNDRTAAIACVCASAFIWAAIILAELIHGRLYELLAMTDQTCNHYIGYSTDNLIGWTDIWNAEEGFLKPEVWERMERLGERFMFCPLCGVNLRVTPGQWHPVHPMPHLAPPVLMNPGLLLYRI